jgi:ABC-type Zn uptake system ZnuABC Zn-binding protein ZnuA
LAAGCSTGLPHSVAGAPVLTVATGLWPLAQAAAAIGGAKVTVVDVVPPGTDPLTFHPDARESSILQGSGLVLAIGGGFQSALEQTAVRAPAVTRLGAVLQQSDPYIWLDPATMGRAVQAIAHAMAAANPPAASLYESNAGDFQDQVQSLGIDYSSTLSACPGRTLVTPDHAFTVMAAAYGLDDHVIGPAPTPAQIGSQKAALTTGAAVAALSQPWVDDHGVDEVAAAASIHVRAVDTLAGAGPGTYFARMEQILGAVSGGLGCNPNEQ